MSQGHQRVGFLSVIPRVLHSFGADPAAVLAKAGLAADALDNPEAVIPYTAMGLLIEACIAASGWDHFGLLVGARVDTASLGLVGQLMRNATTLRAGLRDFALHQHRNGTGAAAYLLEQKEHAIFGYAIYQPGVHAIDAINDGAAAAAFNLIGELIKPHPDHGMTATIARTAPANLEPYKAHFGTTPGFGASHTGAVFPALWLDRPIAGADPDLRQTLRAKVLAFWLADQRSILEQVRRITLVGLLNGHVSATDVATQLAISRRTMDRHLAAAGASFQGLLDEARLEWAKRLMLQTALPLSDIAAIIGFDAPGVFTRTFQKWTGMTPSRWRAST